jgi:hypothetical protein
MSVSLSSKNIRDEKRSRICKSNKIRHYCFKTWGKLHNTGMFFFMSLNYDLYNY